MTTTIGRRLPAVAAVVVFASAALVGCTRHPHAASLPNAPIVVVAAPEAPVWVRLLRASGLSARVGTLREAVHRRAAVVPSSVPLTNDQQRQIRAWVSAGGRLTTAHVPLLRSLGFDRDAKARSVAGADIAGGGLVTWASPADVRGLRPGGSLQRVLPIARSQGLALEATADLGRGRVLALALDPFGGGQEGHERVPWLAQQISALSSPPAGPRRVGVEIYFDPGGLRGPPGQIAELLGDVRAVHVAGWNIGFDDGSDYDYRGLITALHAKGVLVYAWLEPPFVNLKLWDSHPECREKTADGRDAFVVWRHLMALEEPRCFQLAWAVWQDLLTRFDWDGVNVAELYFEPDDFPADMTPFHSSALKRFKGDPKLEPERFLDFRSNLVVELNEAMLRNLNGLPNAKDLDFELTVVDDLLDAVQSRKVGSEPSRLADVARRNGASVQLEDPHTVWSSTPLRYDKLAPYIDALMPKGQAYIDVNVVDRPEARPTTKMTGGELALAVMSAGRSGRVGIYSAGTVPADDLHRLPGAVAGSAETFDTGIKAAWSVVVAAPGGTIERRLLVDGQPWPAGAGSAIVPPGEHRLEWSTGAPRGPALLRLSAEIGEATVRPGGLGFRYDSRVRPFAVLDRPVTTLAIDGQPVPVIAVPGGEGRVVRLPAGNHQADLATGP